jgi:acetylglutamate kinase
MERVIHLLDAIPYVRAYSGQTFVVKVGGDLLSSPKWRDGIARDLSALHRLGIAVVLVHGGGPQLDQAVQDWGLSSPKVAGRRITSPDVLKAALMVWRGRLSSEWVQAFAKHGEKAVGICGFDGGLVRAVKRPPKEVRNEAGELEFVDFGEVGDITGIDDSLITAIHQIGGLPIVSPLAAGPNGEPLNINADTIASELAIAMGASKLILLTRTPGILTHPDEPNSVIPWADIAMLHELRDKGRLYGGMLPKTAAAIRCLENGVQRVHIVDGRRSGALLEEVFTTEGSGTLIVAQSEDCPAEPLGLGSPPVAV